MSAIAVAVAACGRPDGLERCLRAVAGQTLAAAEILVVDQAPSATARAVAQAAGARYLEQERLGLSASRNLALRSSGSDILAVTDDDCAPDAGWLAAVSGAFSRAPRPDAVTGPILPLGEQPPGTYAISLRESDVPVDHRGPIVPYGVGSGGNFSAPVAVLRRHGGWDERLGAGSPGQAAEDADLLYRLLAGGGVVRYEPGAVVRHEWHTVDRRLATRWSYGYGIGAMCALHLARGDAFALRMLGAYARLHVRPLLGAVRHRRRMAAAEHARALASLVPGTAYGLRTRRRGSA